MTSETFIQQLLTLSTILRMLLSPDGKWAAYMWYRIHENIDIFLVPTDGSTPPIPITRTPEATVLINWTADLKSVIVSDDHDQDDRPGSRLQYHQAGFKTL